ncbi:hypothetical protein KBP30_12050 [Streptomyces sp. Go40/10]|uniref:hypothetical protein n=1 Tax=Streptomyces sp. Go40/10 TaxID=2825844 RepID=UPI001E42169D|nr:hypothetical protein [Streptomyces sp. Go40/10]UFR01875.1 hypothetical protein KBP30_12050 [Streptomyces sp. Go40/10]
MRHRRALLPAFAVTSLFLAAACSSTAPPAADGPASGTGQQVRAAEQPAAGTDHSLTVAAAPTAAATATATAGPGRSGHRAHKTSLTVSSYDGRTRRAVIADKPSGKDGSPVSPAPSTGSPGPSARSSGPSTGSPAPSASAATPSAGSSAAPRRAAVGDVIASAPAPGAPHGLLAKVTKVIGETHGGTEVQTEPATLNALLGDATAKGDVPVDPSSFTVDKLLPDVRVSWAKTGDVHAGPKGATVPLGSLRLDVGTEVPTAKDAPASATASVHGFVQVAPQVDFAYGGAGTDAPPGSAYLGVSGDWSSGWAVKGRAAAATGTPLRIPFAKLHADPVLQVGPVPVVVNLDLTCYVQISADGRATVDVEQSLKGDFKAGGTFGAARGWTPVSSSHMNSTPVHASVTAAGDVKTALGAEATVGLYGTVGVTADLAPYLRGEASGTLTAASDRSEPKATGTWAVYGGVDLSGTLRLQLSVFGTPVVQRSIPLGALHREWKLTGGSLSS